MLSRIIKFLGMDPDDERIRETIEFSSVENLLPILYLQAITMSHL
jgi:hypothetical protein